MMNFIAFVFCGAFAVFYGINGKVGLCIFEAALAVMQLSFMIQWIARLF